MLTKEDQNRLFDTIVKDFNSEKNRIEVFKRKALNKQLKVLFKLVEYYEEKIVEFYEEKGLKNIDPSIKQKIVKKLMLKFSDHDICSWPSAENIEKLVKNIKKVALKRDRQSIINSSTESSDSQSKEVEADSDETNHSNSTTKSGQSRPSPQPVLKA